MRRALIGSVCLAALAVAGCVSAPTTIPREGNNSGAAPRGPRFSKGAVPESVMLRGQGDPASASSPFGAN